MTLDHPRRVSSSSSPLPAPRRSSPLPADARRGRARRASPSTPTGGSACWRSPAPSGCCSACVPLIGGAGRGRAAAAARRRRRHPPAQRRRPARARARRRLRPARRRLPRSSLSSDEPYSHEHRSVPVVIVGAGPTGLTAATLLGQYGVECLVLDRWEAVYPQPRAVHLDDEIYRILARLGHRRAVRRDLPALPRAAAGRPEPCGCFAEFRPRHRRRARHGYPEANMFDQPELEAPPARQPHAPDHGHASAATCEVTDVTQDGAGRVRVDVTDRVTGRRRVRSWPSYVLGCDGANSLVRTAIGATMQDLHVRAALAGRRRRHRRRPRPVGGRAPGLRPGPGRDLHADRRRPATAGSSGCGRARPPTTTATSRTCCPLIARGPGTSRSTGSNSCGSRSTPSAPSSPTAGGTGGLPARRRRPPHPAVHRPGHGRRTPGRGEPELEARRRPRPATCPSRSWTPTRPNASRTPAP